MKIKGNFQRVTLTFNEDPIVKYTEKSDKVWSIINSDSIKGTNEHCMTKEDTVEKHSVKSYSQKLKRGLVCLLACSMESSSNTWLKWTLWYDPYVGYRIKKITKGNNLWRVKSHIGKQFFYRKSKSYWYPVN